MNLAAILQTWEQVRGLLNELPEDIQFSVHLTEDHDDAIVNIFVTDTPSRVRLRERLRLSQRSMEEEKDSWETHKVKHLSIIIIELEGDKNAEWSPA